MIYAEVIIDISAEQVDRTFTYAVPTELESRVRPGVRVKLPFGNSGRLRKGVIISLNKSTDYDESRLKAIDSIVEGAQDTEDELITLAAFMAEEYGCTMNQALMTVLPVKASVRKSKKRKDAVEAIREIAGDEQSLQAPVLNEAQAQVADEITAERDKPSLLYGITGSGKTSVYIELIRRM